MSNDVKKEFQSCMTTGIIGLLLAVSIVGGAHYLSEAQKKRVKKINLHKKYPHKKQLQKQLNIIFHKRIDKYFNYSNYFTPLFVLKSEVYSLF